MRQACLPALQGKTTGDEASAVIQEREILDDGGNYKIELTPITHAIPIKTIVRGVPVTLRDDYSCRDLDRNPDP